MSFEVFDFFCSARLHLLVWDQTENLNSLWSSWRFYGRNLKRYRNFASTFFLGCRFAVLTFLVPKFLICFKFHCTKLSKRKIFYPYLFEILSFLYQDDFWICCILHWVFYFMFNSSFKVFIGDYFQIWNYICKKLLQSFWYIIIIRNALFYNYLFLTFFCNFFFQ